MLQTALRAPARDLRRIALAARALVLSALCAGVLAGGAAAEQASAPSGAPAAQLDAGANHTCAILDDGTVRCWGFGFDGQLGYGNTENIGDDETPSSAGAVDLGPGHTAKAISAGQYHTCAILDDGTVRCWGFGANGQLGYGNRNTIESPASAGPVDLGPGRLAKAISVGGSHTCAILDDGTVRCWGFGFDGQLGYGNTQSIGDTETPGSVPPVDLGPGRTAKAISAGLNHTCAILDDNTVRCWGFGGDGRLGYGNTYNVGDGATNSAGGEDKTPASVGPVDLGGHGAVAISAGNYDTCAILDDGTVRCWGYGGSGRLGYGDQDDVGDDETPASVGPVDVGGHRAVGISAGADHTCAILDDGTVRCWGFGANGQLGYGNTNSTYSQTPAALEPVDLGPGRTAIAISAGEKHTCARLDDNVVRCWGYNASGQLGYCDTSNVGDTQTPGSAGPVNLEPGDGGALCPGLAPVSTSPPAPSSTPTAPAKVPGTGGSDAARARGLRSCLAAVAAQSRRARSLTRRGTARQRAEAKRELAGRAARGRRRCLHRYGRIPGPVNGLRALTRATNRIELDFTAPGTDGEHPPPARSYLVEQSLSPIRDQRDFTHAQALCKGACSFHVTQVGANISLTITNLHAHTIYYYAIAARDNVSGQLGPRSQTVMARTQ